MKSFCETEDCNKPVHGCGLCNAHYLRAWKAGLIPPRPKLSIDQRLLKMSDLDENGCWTWNRSKDLRGYGKIGVDGKPRLAHRVSYEFFVGPIPEGLYVDHLCFNLACINPDHLRVVTPKQNQEHRRGGCRDNTSGARNVSWDKNACRWLVRVRHNGKVHWGGRYGTLAEAERAARDLRKELFTHDDYEAWEQAQRGLTERDPRGRVALW